MKAIHHTIRLHSPYGYGKKVPPEPLGWLLAVIPDAVERSLRMAVEGRSTVRGYRPAWLSNTADQLRFVDFEGSAEETILHFEMPRLEDSAGQLYEQGHLWNALPDKRCTGIDLFSRVLDAIGSKNSDSAAFDDKLLGYFPTKFRHGINGRFDTLKVIPQAGLPDIRAGILNKTTLTYARQLMRQTPATERINLVGKLDMMKHSEHGFGLKLDSGEDVLGVLVKGEMDDFKQFFGKRVLVTGMAVYKPSGNILRIDAEGFESGDGAPAIWSRVAPAFKRKLSAKEWDIPQTKKNGIAAIMGKWPGNETEEELLKALKELG